MNKKIMKSSMFLITYLIILLVAIVKIDIIIGLLTLMIKVLMPLFIGGAIAFVLNRPYKYFIEKYGHIFKNKKKLTKAIKPLALTTVYILFISIIFGVLAFVIPQVSESIQLLYGNMGEYGRNLEAFALKASDYLKLDTLDLSKLDETINKLPEVAGGLISGLMPRVFDFTSDLITIVINIVIGFVLSIYILADKVRLKRQFSSMLHVYFPIKFAQRTLEVTRLTSETFTKFVTGQFTEALILGTLCFIGMLIFGFDYSILISVIIGITSLIPIVGAIIGLVPALFILLMIEPAQAMWFFVFIIILQQLEGNLIYPKVVGESIGLPPLWVLLAITIGGGLFGVLGMLLGVPIASVVYQLLKIDVNNRLDTN